MQILKKVVNGSLSLIGCRVSRFGKQTPVEVRYENFVNLAMAYEQRLNESNPQTPILPNLNRPKLLGRLLGTPPSEAYYIVEALARCAGIEGDVCEFGVAQGLTSALIANEIAPCQTKMLHLFDSFEGLPKPTDKDQLKDDIFSLGSMEAYTGLMACPEDMVVSRLNAISFPKNRFVLHKGFFEKIIKTDTALPSRVSFAYVDFDFYEPIKLVLEFLHKACTPGAIIIVDDYDFFSTGAKTAVDEFLKAKNQPALAYKCLIPHTKYAHCAVLQKMS